MTFQLTLQEGTFLVKLARQTVTEYLKTGKVLQVPKNVSSKLMEKCGVFVTLNTIKNQTKMLRGCIGIPSPIQPLTRAVIETAISASTQDPRFPPVKLNELDHIVFEVSVLTPPELVKTDKPTDLPVKIQVGRDGLILEHRYHKGLLLPQVPVEYRWSEEEFLCQTAMKAGLPPDAWLLKDTKIYRFQAIIFEEKIPKGEIVQKEI
ncbi:MAG: TIGR00296 family protein [Candidatus Bathyarchaeota archaeon]|nr:TIGR00296 family protein [Candidatus Bathyarchaeota archaeon]